MKGRDTNNDISKTSSELTDLCPLYNLKKKQWAIALEIL